MMGGEADMGYPPPSHSRARRPPTSNLRGRRRLTSLPSHQLAKATATPTMSSAKRGASRQMTKDDAEEDGAGAEAGTWATAPAEELASRRILKASSKFGAGRKAAEVAAPAEEAAAAASGEASSNPFAALAAAPAKPAAAASANPFGGLAAAAAAPAGETAGTAVVFAGFQAFAKQADEAAAKAKEAPAAAAADDAALPKAPHPSPAGGFSGFAGAGFSAFTGSANPFAAAASGGGGGFGKAGEGKLDMAASGGGFGMAFGGTGFGGKSVAKNALATEDGPSCAGGVDGTDDDASAHAIGFPEHEGGTENLSAAGAAAIPTPPEVEAYTGEENEQCVRSVRVKLYRLKTTPPSVPAGDDDRAEGAAAAAAAPPPAALKADWSEVGVGACRLLVPKSKSGAAAADTDKGDGADAAAASGGPRLVMRRNITFSLILNLPLKGHVGAAMVGDKAVRLTTIDADGPATYLLRAKFSADAAALCEEVVERAKC